MPTFDEFQVASAPAPRRRSAASSPTSGVVGKLLDVARNVTGKSASTVASPDIMPAPTSAAASSGVALATALGVAAVPVILSRVFAGVDRDKELAAVERQQKREMSDRSTARLLSGVRAPGAPDEESDMCGEDDDGVASCERVTMFTDRSGKLRARRVDGSIYMKCERLPDGTEACMRGNKKLVTVRKK